MSTVETPRAYVALALRRDTLVERLETGWRMIDDEPDPARRARLETHWIRLLRSYEEIDVALTALEMRTPVQGALLG
jgi:hypothetical protein